MNRRFICLLLATSILALLLTGFVLYPLISRGMRVGSDSAKYLNSAVNLIEAHQISIGCLPDTVPNAIAAPGYIVILSIPLALGLSWLKAAQGVALACYFLLLLGVGVFTWRITSSFVLSLLTEGALGLHPLVLTITRSVQSEPLSWLLVIAATFLILELVINPRKKIALYLGVVLGCSVLVRYAFVAFLVSCPLMLFLLAGQIPLKKAIGLIGILFLIACLIFGPWLLRNWLVTKNLVAAVRGSGTLWGNTVDASLVWWQVILATGRPEMPRALLIYIPLVALIIAAANSYRRLLARRGPGCDIILADTAYLVTFLLVAGYTTTIIFICTFVNPVDPDRRIFSPMVILFAFLLVSRAGGGTLLPPRRKRSKLAMTLIYLFWVALIIFQGISQLENLRKDTRGYFDWKSSPTVSFAINRFNPSEILVTDPEPFWLWHATYPRYLPRKSDTRIETSSLAEEGIKALIWFKSTHRDYLVQPADIVWNSPFETSVFEDGLVYILSSR